MNKLHKNKLRYFSRYKFVFFILLFYPTEIISRIIVKLEPTCDQIWYFIENKVFFRFKTLLKQIKSYMSLQQHSTSSHGEEGSWFPLGLSHMRFLLLWSDERWKNQKKNFPKVFYLVVLKSQIHKSKSRTHLFFWKVEVYVLETKGFAFLSKQQ